jgi:TRAP-type C4-dicarboxylate transport system substrate-binding protein
MNIKARLCLQVALALLAANQTSAQEKLTMFYPGPLESNWEKLFSEWARKVEADSKNTLVIEVKANSPLANFTNIIDRVENDVVQIGIALASIFPRRFELTQIVAVPFTIDLDDDDQASTTVWRLYKAGLLDSEYDTMIPLFVGVSKQSGFHFARPPKSLDQLQGLKMRIFASSQLDMVKSLGMSPVSLPPTDIYLALQRGTLDGTITSWTSFPSLRLQEVTKYHVELPLGGSVFIAFMSRKKYNALPEAARRAIDANANESYSRAFGRVLGEDAEKGKKLSAGHTIVRLTPEKTAEWRQKFGDAMAENWRKANAPQSEKVLEAFARIYADVKAGR